MTDYIITSCAHATDNPNVYIFDQFFGNLLAIQLPTIIIHYIAPDSYEIHMSDELFFTVSGRIIDNQHEDIMTTSGGIAKDPANAICGSDVLLVQQLVHVKFIANSGSYLNGDYYQFVIGKKAQDQTLLSALRCYRTRSPINSTLPPITMITATPYNINNNVNTINMCHCNNKKKVKVPRLIIETQTTVDGINLSDLKITIGDIKEYYDCKSIIGTACPCKSESMKVKNVKETIFRMYAEKINLTSVLKGKGCNALEKAEYIYKKDKKLQSKVDFYTFYYNHLTLYSMSRYALSRLLYGDFNINYVCTKYDKEFYKNLANSRFCQFVKIYTGEDNLKSYYKYFKYK
jgi:hypothetical protein